MTNKLLRHCEKHMDVIMVPIGLGKLAKSEGREFTMSFKT